MLTKENKHKDEIIAHILKKTNTPNISSIIKNYPKITHPKKETGSPLHTLAPVREPSPKSSEAPI
jgi:hypothetical protein